MDENRLFGHIDSLGPPFHVKMEEITHNAIRASWDDLGKIYGCKLGLTRKISHEKLEVHGFNHWMTPSITNNPFLPAKPGWPGLMLRLGDELEEWRPDGGVEFRVVTGKEPDFLEYVGQYEMVRLDDITGDECQRQLAKVTVLPHALSLFQLVDISSKIRKRWTNILGGEGSWHWHAAVARVALRNKLGREPSTQEITRYSEKLNPANYTTLAQQLEDDIDQAFCRGEEVYLAYLS